MLVLSGCGSPTSSSIPPEVERYATDWPLPNKDYANTRATMDSSINSFNVDDLGVAWSFSFPSGGAFGSASSTPLILGDTVYFQDLSHNIYTLDFLTGELEWQKTYDVQGPGPNGPAAGWDKIFASSGPYTIAALDIDSGEQLWEQAISGVEMGAVGIDIQPTVYDDMVFVSTVAGSSNQNFYAAGAVGVIHALAEDDGEIEWKWNTVDSEDIWGNSDVNSGGGCWYPPAVDTETSIVYWSVANPAPFPGTAEFPNGSSRPGPNLYTNCLVAQDSGDGNLRWYTQALPHDIKDYDLEASPMLCSANINGVDQPIVVSAGKIGRVYAFNRDTGALLWVTVVGRHQNDQLAAFPPGETTSVFPGLLGGVETPMAYADGVAYVPVNNLGTDFTPTSVELHPFSENTGGLVAIEVDTGKILWEKELPAGNYGGATVVNDLVFTATFAGTIYALHRDTGQQVWNYQASAGINAWPAVARDTIIWPVAGRGGPPALVAFRIGATQPIVQIATPTQDTTFAAGDVTVQILASNFELVDKLGVSNAAGEGHAHYYLDVDPPTMPGQPAVTAPGTYAATAGTSHTWTNVTAGHHTLAVQLVNNDHTPLTSPVVDEVAIMVTNDPMIDIATPANGVVMPPSVQVSVNVQNFQLVDDLGEAPAPGEGHIIYYLNTEPPSMPGQPATTDPGSYVATAETSHTWSDLAPGKHTLWVQLVNNDDTPLDPPATAQVFVFVAVYSGAFGGQ